MGIKIQLLVTEEDKPYLYHIKESIPQGLIVGGTYKQFEFISEIRAAYMGKGITHIITTQQKLIPMLCNTASDKEQTLNNYQGSWIEDDVSKIIFLFINPLKYCTTIPYGRFLLDRYVSKIYKPETWINIPSFFWKILNTQEEFEYAYRFLQDSTIIGIDIETNTDLLITSISYTGVQIQKEHIIAKTFVIDLDIDFDNSDYVDDLEYKFSWIARYNLIEVLKVLQNGKYDASYLQLYSCPIHSYLLDTAVMHHCSFAELPKDLGMLAAFYIRNGIFWKDEKDGNKMDQLRYNGLDSFYTAFIALAWIFENTKESSCDSYAINNYLLEFPVIHANFLAESIGVKCDFEVFEKVKLNYIEKQNSILEEIKDNLGEPNYNPNSPPQNKIILTILGCEDLKSTDESAMNRAAFRHPFNHWIIDKIISYKKLTKLIGTYLNEDKIFTAPYKKEVNPRVLYSITPTTDTGRNASKSHHFWTGFNKQNIPRDGDIKKYFIADEGFLLGEADNEQAESRDTAYITGDINLLNNVNDNERDFHRTNASLFFGIAYELITKPLRQLSKPINHGANYLMGEETLIDEMGLPAIFEAAKYLNLRFMGAKQIANYLLHTVFGGAYPTVHYEYPEWIKGTIKTLGRLINAYGWTRICFSNPLKDKRALRVYVAHLPQSTNAMATNKAFIKVFNEVWKPNADNFRLLSQVHDSIFFEYRIGHEYLAYEVKRCMEEANVIDVTDIKGITRTLKVPVDLKFGAQNWKQLKEM